MNSPAADVLLCPWWTHSGKLNINFKEFLWWFMFYKFRSVVEFYFLSLDQRNWQTLRAPWWQSLFNSTQAGKRVLSCVIFIAIPILALSCVQLGICQSVRGHVPMLDYTLVLMTRTELGNLTLSTLVLFNPFIKLNWTN